MVDHANSRAAYVLDYLLDHSESTRVPNPFAQSGLFQSRASTPTRRCERFFDSVSRMTRDPGVVLGVPLLQGGDHHSVLDFYVQGQVSWPCLLVVQ